jgi:hypothetical protein
MEPVQELLTLPDLLIRQAEIFRYVGLDVEARDALSRAVDLFARKGASAEVRRARDLLATIDVG